MDAVRGCDGPSFEANYMRIRMLRGGSGTRKNFFIFSEIA
jgi:hypothetical protein